MRGWVLLPLGLVCACALAQASHDMAPPPHDAPHPRSATRDPNFARFAAEMDAGMAVMMRDMHAGGYSGNVDVDFLRMMIAHHEGAVEMARLALIHGRDPLTRKLAEEIIATQVVEIEGMKRRLAILRGAPVPAQDDFPALGGTRGPTER